MDAFTFLLNVVFIVMKWIGMDVFTIFGVCCYEVDWGGCFYSIVICEVYCNEVDWGMYYSPGLDLCGQTLP